jgi:hypothetical protein
VDGLSRAPALAPLLVAQEWARSQVDAAKAKAAARQLHFTSGPEEPIEWGCPKCRATYAATDIPKDYRCFCKKGARRGSSRAPARLLWASYRP